MTFKAGYSKSFPHRPALEVSAVIAISVNLLHFYYVLWRKIGIELIGFNDLFFCHPLFYKRVDSAPIAFHIWIG